MTIAGGGSVTMTYPGGAGSGFVNASSNLYLAYANTAGTTGYTFVATLAGTSPNVSISAANIYTASSRLSTATTIIGGSLN